ncbi:MAG: PhoU domain-containing protein [Methanobacteriota archaeon]
MDVRKLQKTGGATFVVSLPKDWVLAAGLGAGDAVSFERRADGGLLLTTSAAAREPRRRRIDLSGKDRDAVEREVIASYLAGFDYIEFSQKPRIPAQTREHLRQLTRKIIGPEIVEETQSTLLVQDLLDPTDLPLRRGVQRMYFMTKAMHRDAIEALLSRDGELARDVVERDDDVDRLFWLVTRQYHAILSDAREVVRTGVGASEGLSYLLVARLLERIGDHASRVAANVPSLGRGGAPRQGLADELARASGLALEVLDEAFRAFSEADMGLANAAIGRARALEPLRDHLTGLIVGLRGREAVHYAYVVESLMRTASYATDIAEIAIHHHVAQRGTEAGSG